MKKDKMWIMENGVSREKTVDELKKEFINRICGLMIWTNDRALLWMTTENANFGNVSPNWMLERGLGRKVDSFITWAEEEAGTVCLTK